MQIEVTLRLLTLAIVEHYSQAGDKTTPSVVVSNLPDNANKWYVSVVRYRGAYARDKEVVCSAIDVELGDTLTALAKLWRNKVAPPQDKRKLLFNFLDSQNKQADISLHDHIETSEGYY